MDYIEEIKKLPSEVQDVLFSSFGALINREIAAKYNLDDKQQSLFIGFTNDLYLKTLKIDNLEAKLAGELKLAADKAHLLALDIAGLKLLIADDYFKGEILSYLSKNNADLTGYGRRVMEERIALEKERKLYSEEDEKPLKSALNTQATNKKVENNPTSRFIDLDDPINAPADLEAEKKSAIELFKEALLDTLESPADFEEIIEDYNETLIELLKDENFKKDLEDALYSNQEKISENRINFEDREVDGTVANYLRDFIKTNGSEFFSGVVLAQYLSNSVNTKKLNSEQKHLVGQLLKLYRNLSFFPDSMGNLPLENWQVIPFEKAATSEIPKSTLKSAVASIKEDGPVRKSPLSIKDDKPSKVSPAPVKAVQPEIIKDDYSNIPDELVELEKEILDYPEGSLEYRALQQEMKRFSGSKKK